jgi:MoaA/NifB/PqqE/SkfB family radical SAM enzyme
MHHTHGVRSRINGALRLLGAATNQPLVGPRVVGLEITHYCNVACGFCESHGRLMPAPIVHRRAYEGGRRALDLETITKLSRSMANLGVAWVELSGKGDPIVHPKLPEIIRIIKQAGLQVSMFTNGSVPRPDLATTLVDSGLDRLNVSLNAASKEVWAKVAGKDLWERVLAFLEDVLAKKKAAGRSEPWVRVSFVVCKDNVEDMERSIELCLRLGVNEGGWCVMGELPENLSLQLDHDEVERLIAAVPEWRRKLDAAGITHDLEAFHEDLKLRIGERGEQANPMQRGLPCYEGWMHAVIGPDGAVAPCCYCEKTNLGNVVDQDFAEVWRGGKYADFRKRSLEMPKSQKPICWECYTTCNRAHENRRTHQRIHPLSAIKMPNGEPVSSK